MRNRVVDII